MEKARDLVPWFIILLCLYAMIFTSSFLATIISRITKKVSVSPEIPDVTRAPNVSIRNMPLVTKPLDQPEWYLYSSAVPTRDDDDSMDEFRKNISRR